MIPDSMSGQSLRFFFAEHLFVPLVFGGDSSDRGCGDYFRVKDDSSDKVVTRSFVEAQRSPFLRCSHAVLLGVECG